MTPEEIYASCPKIMDMHGITVHHIRDALQTGALFDNGDGFVILRPVEHEELTIWLCVSRGTFGFTQRNLAELKRIGRDLGARKLVFYSKRRGWTRLASDWTVMPHGEKLRFELEL